MKQISIFLFFVLLVSVSGLKAQQNVAVTVIFQNNLCQAYHNNGQTSSKIEYQIVGLSDIAANQFVTKSLKHEGIITSSISTTTNKGMRTGKIEIFSQADFDFIKNIFIEGGVAFVKVEDEIFPIDSWKLFTDEQCTKLTNLNQIIYNIETKRNWILNNPEEKEKAEQNGWFTKNDGYYNKAIQDKKEFLQSIK